MLSGKDHIAQLAGCHTLNPADPIYLLAQRILGTDDKSQPGVRRFMQLVGQWGWGCLTTDYPLSVERALFIDKLRYMGLEGGWMAFNDKTGMPMEALLDFGRDKEFWLNILLDRMKQLVNQQQHTLEWLNSAGEKAKEFEAFRPEVAARARQQLNLAVSSVRYAHELAPLARHGFQHYLVLCSETTRAERMAAKGYKASGTEALDISEHLAIALVSQLPDTQIIWNDLRPMPEGKNYLSVEEFTMLWRNEKPVA